MKVAVIIDIPDDANLMGDDIEQVVYDNFVKHSLVHHIKDRMIWACKEKEAVNEANLGGVKIIQRLHENWAQILENVKIEVQK